MRGIPSLDLGTDDEEKEENSDEDEDKNGEEMEMGQAPGPDAHVGENPQVPDTESPLPEARAWRYTTQ